MIDERNLRGALTLCAVLAASFIIWLLGAIWQEARTISGSVSEIVSPGPALWWSQHALIVLLMRLPPQRNLILGGIVFSVFLPIWVLLYLIDQTSLTTLLRAHMTGLVALSTLTAFAVILSTYTPVRWRANAVAGVQVLCLSALFGLSSAAISWVF